jgi:Leucine rich repeat N-terminal domain
MHPLIEWSIPYIRSTRPHYRGQGLRRTLGIVAAALGLALGAASSDAAIPASERAALLALYNSTNGANWTVRTNWNSAAGSECTWYGVTCSAGDANVTEITLPGNNLVGSIPSLTGLTALQRFAVNQNQLTGSIPSLAGLTALRYFDAYINQLTGSIPSLTGLTALQQFSVSLNQLTGSIPPLTGLTALQTFVVDQNQLTGPIPSLAGLSALQFFFVNQNQLTGPIPSLAGLSALRSFDAYSNQLTGLIPPLTELTALRDFRVSQNQLTGSIPSLAGLAALQRFFVNENQLTGSIPSLAGLTALQRFYVGDNQLTGNLPDVPTPTNNLLSNDGASLCPNQLTVSPNALWNAATPGTTWDIGCVAARPNQTLSFGAPPFLVLGGSGTVSASASPTPNSALPVVFASLTPAVCTVTVNTGVVTVQPTASVGSICTLTANKAGDATANSAAQAQLSITINAPVINANATAVPTLGGLYHWGLAGLMLLLVGIRDSIRRQPPKA